MAEKQHSTLAREVLEWLAHNEQGHFNITCQRCGSPFAHEGQPVAAPAEWFGGLDWERQLAESILSLEEQLEAAQRVITAARNYLRPDVWIDGHPLHGPSIFDGPDANATTVSEELRDALIAFDAASSPASRSVTVHWDEHGQMQPGPVPNQDSRQDA